MNLESKLTGSKKTRVGPTTALVIDIIKMLSTNPELL